MLDIIKEIEALGCRHGEQGSALLQACDGLLFPCDALACSVLERSLNLSSGFCLLLKNSGYTCGVALLRMQLDNVLRLHGVVTTTDPHGVASDVINGTPLRNIKGKDGKLMTDKHLAETLSTKNPWISRVYNLTSGYIHLSEQHFLLFLERSNKNQNGLRDFVIGEGDEHINEAAKTELANAFKVVTDGVIELVRQWITIRSSFGEKQALMERFSNSV